MKTNEYKTIKISPELHKELKIYCAENSLKLNNWIEQTLIQKINELKNEKIK
jgi:predicted HicB family RNase H-like nuclease